jgi:hypothetical protein
MITVSSTWWAGMVSTENRIQCVPGPRQPRARRVLQHHATAATVGASFPMWRRARAGPSPRSVICHAEPSAGKRAPAVDDDNAAGSEIPRLYR